MRKKKEKIIYSEEDIYIQVKGVLCNHKMVNLTNIKSVTNFKFAEIKKALEKLEREGIAYKSETARFWRVKKKYSTVELFEKQKVVEGL